MSRDTLGDFIRHRLDTMTVDELFPHTTPLPQSDMQGLAFDDRVPTDRSRITFVQVAKLPDRRKRTRE